MTGSVHGRSVLLDGISHWYHPPGHPAVCALENVTHRFEGGKVHALIGPGACGMSTLLQIVRGLVRPTAGEVSFEPGPEPPTMAAVWQGSALVPWRTVLDNVAVGLEIAGAPRADRLDRARTAIDVVGLAGFAHHSPSDLPGGMAQRVGLARALATGPGVLLLDEPFGSLDARTRLVVQERMDRTYTGSGRTVLVATQSIDEALLLADHVVVMTSRPGRIQEVVPVDLPRPRCVETTRDPEFTRLFEHLYQCLKSEVMRSVGRARPWAADRIGEVR